MVTGLLSGNATTRVPSRHVFFDCETLPSSDPHKPRVKRHSFRLGVAHFLRYSGSKIHSRDALRFSDPQHFWQWLYAKASPQECLHIWAHNLAFDFTVGRGWEELEDGELLYEGSFERRSHKVKGEKETVSWKGCFVTQDPPCFWILRRSNGGVLKFIDTYNWWQTSVERLGDKFGLEKLTMPVWGASDLEWFRYCERDVEVIERAMCSLFDWIRKEDLGCLKLTAASQSIQAWRHRFMPRPPQYHDTRDVRALERASYYGGQNLVNYVGHVVPPAEWSSYVSGRKLGRPVPAVNGPIYHLDVRSLYPSVMKDNLYPVHLERVLRRPPLADFAACLKLWGGCAWVTLSTRDPYPYRVKPGETAYAVGTFSTALCGPELVRAWQSGCIVDVEMAAFWSLADLFTGFVSYFWKQRTAAHRKGDVVQEELVKLIMNSLSGKFAQLTPEWVEADGVSGVPGWGIQYLSDPEDGVKKVYRSLWDLYQEHTRRVERLESIPIISAFITSYGREEMRRLRDIAGPRNVLYQATDSLHVTFEGRDRLAVAGEIAGWELGKLHQRQYADRAEYRGHNAYCLDGIWTVAGVKKGSVKVGPETWRGPAFERLESILRRRPGGVVEVEERDVSLPHGPAHGVVETDGWVRPLELGMESVRKFLFTGANGAAASPVKMPRRRQRGG